MKRFVFAVLVMLSVFSMPSWAGCTIQSNDLSEVAKKQLEVDCLKAEAAAAINPIGDAERISKYAGIATEVAEAIGIAAKNLGVEVNNFITTPAGMLTVAIILIKIFGKLLGMIMAAIFLNYITFKILNWLWTEQTEGNETAEVSSWFGWRVRKVPVRRRIAYKNAHDSVVGWTFVLLAMSMASIAAIPVVGL